MDMTSKTKNRAKRLRSSYAGVTATVALFLALGGGAYAAASSIVGSDGQVHGCYQNDGDLRVISPSSSCRRSEHALSWSQQGPKGDTGATGATGAAGSNGANGAKGDTGPQGDPGTKGDTGPQGVAGAKGDTGAQGDPGAKGDAGPQGDPGAKGDAGPQGTQGPQGDPGTGGFTTPLHWTNGSIGIGAVLTDTADRIVSNECPAGQTVYGGGYWITPENLDVRVTESAPNAAHTKWYVALKNTDTRSGTLNLYALCGTAQ
jgi:hypothetical protein